MNRWGGKRVRARTAMVLGALVATGVLAVPRPAPADTRLRFWDFNLCGASCNHGDLVKVVGEVRGRIVAFRPNIATLNEACQAQVEALGAQLSRSSWPMDHVFNDQREDDRCPPVNGKRLFGDAIFSTGGLGSRDVVPLPQSKGGWDDDRAVMCVNTHLPREVLACVVHLEADAPAVNAKQRAALARFVNPRATKGPVVLAGDFNAEPGTLEALAGPMVDLVSGKRTRNGQKIDYIWVSRGSFSNFTGGVKGSKYSDHRAISGSADLRGGPPPATGTSTTTSSTSTTTTTTTAPRSRHLLGTRWAVEGSDAYVVLHGEGTFDGSTGCNQMSGTFARRGRTITFTGMSATKRACDGKGTDLERSILSVLDGDVDYEIVGDDLHLGHESGKVLELRAR